MNLFCISFTSRGENEASARRRGDYIGTQITADVLRLDIFPGPPEIAGVASAKSCSEELLKAALTRPD